MTNQKKVLPVGPAAHQSQCVSLDATLAPSNFGECSRVARMEVIGRLLRHVCGIT